MLSGKALYSELPSHSKRTYRDSSVVVVNMKSSSNLMVTGCVRNEITNMVLQFIDLVRLLTILKSNI